MSSTTRIDRRAWLSTAATTLATLRLADAERSPKRLRVGAVITTCFYRSHAHVILENFLNPYLFNGQVVDAGMDVVSLYVDQFPKNDMARSIAESHSIPVYDSIAGALTRGGKELDVDAVLSIGEHGDYPVNHKAQRMYPRKRFFDEIVAVFRRSGRTAPVFNDKHLSYRWDWAKEMVDTARRLHIPLMAGSSVPLAERRPPLELPAGAAIREAVSIHGGGVESYDFHGLEVLQSMVEARRGGESGVARLRFLDFDRLWRAAERKEWSTALAQSAMRAELGPDHELVRCFDRRGLDDVGKPVPMHGIQLEYADGLRAIMLKVADSGIRWNFACRMAGESAHRATSFYVGPWNNRNLFKALSHAIQTHFRNRRAPYPVERTLLTTGMLDAAMDSRIRHGKWLDTPHLTWHYEPRDYRAMREMGATWKLIPPGTPQPRGLDHASLHLGDRAGEPERARP